MLALQETIRPSADLRNHYNEISKQCREDKEAVINTLTEEKGKLQGQLMEKDRQRE